MSFITDANVGKHVRLLKGLRVPLFIILAVCGAFLVQDSMANVQQYQAIVAAKAAEAKKIAEEKTRQAKEQAAIKLAEAKKKQQEEALANNSADSSDAAQANSSEADLSTEIANTVDSISESDIVIDQPIEVFDNTNPPTVADHVTSESNDTQADETDEAELPTDILNAIVAADNAKDQGLTSITEVPTETVSIDETVTSDEVLNAINRLNQIASTHGSDSQDETEVSTEASDTAADTDSTSPDLNLEAPTQVVADQNKLTDEASDNEAETGESNQDVASTESSAGETDAEDLEKQPETTFVFELRNPEKNRVELALLINGQVVRIKPGDSYTSSQDSTKLIRMHRGQGRGEVKYKVSSGVFEIHSDNQGWHIVRLAETAEI
ncbi:MAG: hypothetical protein KDA87_17610 [Planctomycetales bacterium]|nr:hypothetical protein [Planctomycetales bacterium]